MLDKIKIGLGVGLFFLVGTILNYPEFAKGLFDYATSKELPECYDSEIVNKRIPTFSASELRAEGLIINSSQIKISNPIELEDDKNYSGKVVFRVCEAHVVVEGPKGTYHATMKYNLDFDSNQKSRLLIRSVEGLN